MKQGLFGYLGLGFQLNFQGTTVPYLVSCHNYRRQAILDCGSEPGPVVRQYCQISLTSLAVQLDLLLSIPPVWGPGVGGPSCCLDNPSRLQWLNLFADIYLTQTPFGDRCDPNLLWYQMPLAMCEIPVDFLKNGLQILGCDGDNWDIKPELAG